jgi:ATP-dependent Clp protease ATP-binding subunit ClpX
MVTNKTYEYGIKYRVIKISKDQFIMIPVTLEGGLSDGFDFSNGKEAIPIANEKKNFRKRYLMDNVFTTEELEEIYNYEEDTDFLSNYFFDDYKNTIYLVQIENSKVKKYAINLSKFKEHEYDMTYHLDKNTPIISLNEDALNELMNTENPDELKILLKKYQELLKQFGECNKKSGVVKINVDDGHVTSIETEKKVADKKSVDVDKKKEYAPYGGVEVTYDGLKKAIKENVFGHDEEIDTFAQKLYMNYTAEEGEYVDSILLVGPTGTGKTETVRAACDYLCIPFFEANAANLVPQGIKGMSIEDVVIGIYELAGRDINLAQRGLIFLDEYDKINASDLDIKQAVKQILLSFNDGGKIHVRDDMYDIIFDSKMTNKVYAGVFDRISEKGKTVGFGTKNEVPLLGSDEEIRQKIIDKGYFSLEEISRIPTILGYNELSRDVKRQILLYSKLSVFAKKRERYKRQFGIDLLATDDYIEAILDSISNSATGMRSVNNYVKKSIDNAERAILENERSGFKKLVLTKDTVSDSTKFDMTK